MPDQTVRRSSGVRLRAAMAGLKHGYAACSLVVATVACGGSTPTAPSSPSGPPTTGEAVLVGAGDIATCGVTASEATAKLLDGIPGTVFTAGDHVYNGATLENFQNCYGPTWGRHRERTRPSPGNHDQETSNGIPYYTYFGANAGPIGLGYYSYNLQSWHVVSLNSTVPADSGSAQAQWLRQDLESNRAGCTVAYWHHALFSSGQNGDHSWMQDIWRILYDAGVDVVLNGDDHLYERFAPQDPAGRADVQRGIREFIVGTGGADLYGFPHLKPNSEVRASVHGVLKLTLTSGSYTWEFVPVAGEAFRDSGTGVCH
jgi:acid phosphatase type 7